MSRARDMANLGAQAGSGLDASDITTGTLGNTVQDNITRLGTVTTGTMNNTLSADATFPSGHTLQIVNHTNTYNTDVSSTGYTVVDSASGVDWEPSIDMLKSTSKLLAIFSLALVGIRNGGSDGRGRLLLEFNVNNGGWSTAVEGDEVFGAYDYGYGGASNGGIWQPALASIQHYTFPNTTGTVKYRISIRCTDASGTVRHARDPGTDPNRQSQATFIEIQG